MKKYSILTGVIASTLLLASPVLFAEAPVVDGSQDYAADNRTMDENPQQPLIHDNQNYQSQPQTQNNYMQQGDAEIQASNDANSQDPVILLGKINALQQQVQSLRGQLEIQSHDINELKQQQQDFYKDLDSRITAISKGGPVPATAVMAANDKTTAAPAASTAAAEPASGLPSMDEQATYAAAYSLLRNKEFDKSMIAMQQFLLHYPNSTNAVNAHYWLGELYLADHKTDFAIKEFNIVLQQYPNSLKTDAAMLKLGFAYADKGDIEKAQQLLQKVEQRFPDTTTAKLAKNRLSLLKTAKTDLGRR